MASNRPCAGPRREDGLRHGIDPGASGERYRWSSTSTPSARRSDQPGSRPRGCTTFPRNVSAPACDASRVVMRHGRDGRVVEVVRAPAPSLRRTAALHTGPRLPFPGCGAGSDRDITSSLGPRGPTTLSNLALLCPATTAPFTRSYQLDRQPDGELRFRRPDGASARGALLWSARRSRQDLRAQHDARGLPERATTTRWWGSA